MKEQADALRSQYQDLSSQFYGNSDDDSKKANGNDDTSPNPSDNALKSPNNPALSEDFARASTTPSNLKQPSPQHPVSKSVRFTDTLASSAEDEDPNRAALLQPYRDSPSPGIDHSSFSNQQIHDYHSHVMREQDDHLDRLGESIGRQHQLSIQIGDELEGQVALLDEVDGHVDRHTSRLDRAKRSLGKFSRSAGQRQGIMTIIGLIICLVILIVILK